MNPSASGPKSRTTGADTAARGVRRTQVADFRWNGYRCDLLALDLDQAEHERRQSAGLGALGSFTLLEPLMVLPEGCPIPWDAIDPRLHATLRRMPDGVFEPWRADLLRLAVRPARNFLALVKAQRWAQGHLDRASRFAPVGQRAVILAASAKTPTPDQLSEADFWGIGVARIAPSGGLEWLLAPAPYRPRGFTSAAWRFAEGVYGAWLAASAATHTEAALAAHGSINDPSTGPDVAGKDRAR
jgi:hypothetical protein